MSGLPHDFAKQRMERVTVERLLACLDRAPTDLWAGIPAWTYTFEGVGWYVEVTTASPYAAQLGQAHAKRLKENPLHRNQSIKHTHPTAMSKRPTS
jgi:hypothetical protein